MNRLPLRFLAFLLLAHGLSSGVQAQDLLPDIIVRESDLWDHDVVTDGNEVLLRLSTGTPNIGEGPLHVVGVFPANPDGSQDVNQRIFRTDGSFYDRPAGQYDFHSGHNHVHLEGWAIYRLREVLPDNGVGDIVAQSEKTSFCLLDSAVHDSSLPGFSPDRTYRTCGETFQGISVGWVDIYGKELIGQNIDIKDLPQGDYWLETVADPDNRILELNEDNNTTRIRITIGAPDRIDGPLEETPEDLHGDDHNLPDLRIGAKPDPDSHRGNDIYEPAGDNHDGHDHESHDHGSMIQILRLRSGKARKLAFYASLQNESADSNAYIIQCSGGRPGKLRIRHFDTSGSTARNISARVGTSGYVANMEADEMMTFRSKVVLTRKSVQRRRKGKAIRCTLGLKAWNAVARDEAWIYLRFP